MTPQNKPSAEIFCQLRQAVPKAQSNTAFMDALHNVLTDAEKLIDKYHPNCQACGRCCDFRVMDHRLFVSTGELALLTRDALPAAVEPLRCGYQIRKRCGNRQNRPLGCRIFYCENIASNIPENIYEKFHRRIMTLHLRHNIAYHYVELTTAMEKLIRCEKSRLGR